MAKVRLVLEGVEARGADGTHGWGLMAVPEAWWELGAAAALERGEAPCGGAPVSSVGRGFEGTRRARSPGSAWTTCRPGEVEARLEALDASYVRHQGQNEAELDRLQRVIEKVEQRVDTHEGDHWRQRR